MSLTVGSLYAGVGGIELAFQQAGSSLSWAYEIDPHAVATYRANFTHHPVIEADIAQAEPPSYVDILTAGIPCQPFSVASSKARGFADTRGTAFYDVMRFADAVQPQIIFIENVKNFLRHDGGRTFDTVHRTMENHGYRVFHTVLNSCHSTPIPQNRERTFIIGFRDPRYYDRFTGEYDSQLCNPPPKRQAWSELLEAGPVAERYYYRENRSCYRELEAGVTSADIMYQWRRTYVRQNKRGLCPTLTANMGTGGHNVPIIRVEDGIRKLTPRECFNFQGFPGTFQLPSSTADSHLYKQAGNSVTVPTVYKLAECLTATALLL